MTRRRSSGQSAIEYLIVVMLLSLALAAGPNSPLQMLVGAIDARYQAFTEAISRP
ncbi:MAG: hypothetical protein J0H09_26375 [Burkholderiales bacterium]|nr:hypothetical protein [Burkholderiales bacterium]